MLNHILKLGIDIKSKDTKTVYYLLTFLINLSASLTFATYVLFLLGKGLDLFQVMLVNLSFMIGNFIFEIPTGAYADYFGRKKSIILSNLFMIFALLIYFESSSLIMFIVAEIVAALAYTFASGALDAWVVDSLEKNRFTGKVDFVFSQSNIISQLAVLVGGLVGGYVGSISLELPFGVGAVVAFAALLVSMFFMQEEMLSKKVLNVSSSISQMGSIAKESIRYGIRHKVVLWLISSTTLAMFAFMPLNMYWSPRFNEMSGNQVWLMGWIWVCISLAMMAGSFLVKQFLKKEKSYLWILIFTVLTLGIPIIVVATTDMFFIVLMGFLVYEIGRGMLSPVHKAYLNKHIPSEQRATILSFDSMIGKLGAALGLLFFGWIAKNTNIQTSWLMAGFTLLFLIPTYLRVKYHEKKLATR